MNSRVETYTRIERWKLNIVSTCFGNALLQANTISIYHSYLKNSILPELTLRSQTLFTPMSIIPFITRAETEPNIRNIWRVSDQTTAFIPPWY